MRTCLRLLGIAFVALGYVAAACADQAEGERCDPNSNDSDCAGDLKCTKLSALNGTTSTAAVCCPRPGVPATAEICLQQSASIPDDGGTPGSGGDSAGGASAGGEASTGGASSPDAAATGGASSGGASADASAD